MLDTFNSAFFFSKTLVGILGMFTAYVEQYRTDLHNHPEHIVLKFDNGYGASIIPCGKGHVFWELAVLDKDGNLCFDTPVANDVMPWLDKDKLQKTLKDIYCLPKEK